MIYKTDALPIVDPLFVRRISKIHGCMSGGYFVCAEADFEDIGMIESRLDYDADTIDCSRKVFELTCMQMTKQIKDNLMVLPSRRWRNNRVGEEIILKDKYIDFVGNPIKLLLGDGISVCSDHTYEIKSGVALGY